MSPMTAKEYSDSLRRLKTRIYVFGGCGYTKDYPMERVMRDAKITEICEGAGEVQRIIVCNGLYER